MLKFLFKLIGFAIALVAICLALFYLFAVGGIADIKEMITDYGFWGFVKQFFIEIWNGFRATCGF